MSWIFIHKYILFEKSGMHTEPVSFMLSLKESEYCIEKKISFGVKSEIIENILNYPLSDRIGVAIEHKYKEILNPPTPKKRRRRLGPGEI